MQRGEGDGGSYQAARAGCEVGPELSDLALLVLLRGKTPLAQLLPVRLGLTTQEVGQEEQGEEHRQASHPAGSPEGPGL